MTQMPPSSEVNPFSGMTMWLYDNAGKTALGIMAVVGQWLVRKGIRLSGRVSDVERELDRVKDASAVDRARAERIEEKVHDLNITMATVITRLDDNRDIINNIPEQTALALEDRLRNFSRHERD